MKTLILPGAGQLARFPGMRTKWLLAIPRLTFNEKNVSLFNLNVFLRFVVVALKEHLIEHTNKKRSKKQIDADNSQPENEKKKQLFQTTHEDEEDK